MTRQLVVIGGGAAGFFCAINAAALNPGLKVTILEKSNKLLSKVKVSGGGRCNVTHACFDIPELVKKYPRGERFLKKAFYQFNTNHTVEWFAGRGVQLKTEPDGRMFPITNTSQTIIDCLLHEAARHGVGIIMQSEVTAVRVVEDYFELQTTTHKLQADYVCVACGGYPKHSMFGWLAGLGHSMEAPVPSLFTFNIPDNAITQLMGVSVEKAVVKIKETKLAEEGPVLITHWGLSGPAILRLSAWGARELAARNYAFTISVNWLPHHHEQSLRDEWAHLRISYASQKMSGKNPFGLPARLWLHLLTAAGIHDNKRWSDVSSKEQNALIKLLVLQEFYVKGKTTFKEEFVTCGGIKLSEINPDTMQSKFHPGLYFAGEIMDVDGITGGFNFQHAWTSGWIAANAIT